MKNSQEEIWRGRTHGTKVENVIAGYRKPYTFQREFTDYMNQLGTTGRGVARLKVCELGCEFGVTSLLLSEKIFERHALDLNPEPLELLAQAAQKLDQNIQVYVRDMFQTGWPDETFNVVFNNGVLEHYEVSERIAALKECARITRKGGYVIVGVPNHCSFPYRFAYLLRRVLGIWHYPPENKIRTFAEELKALPSLKAQRLLLFDQETIFVILPRSRITAWPFRLWHHLWKFEPYLRVFEMRRV